MGVGDYLMMTAVAREAILNNKNIKKVRIFRVRGTKKQYYYNNHFTFMNNPYAYRQGSLDEVLDIYFGVGKNPQGGNCYHYNNIDKKKGKWNLRNPNVHAITQYCRQLKITDNPSLKCELYFSKAEEEKISKLIQDHLGDKPFIVIEPHSKRIMAQFPLNKFQNIVDQLSKKITFVQVGLPKKGRKILQNVINFVGKLNFRESALLIRSAKLVIAPEGGLMHGTNAAGGRGIFLFSGFMEPEMTCYPENINIQSTANHNCHSLKCKFCEKDKKNFNEQIIIDKVNEILESEHK